MELRDYLRILARRWWLFVLPVLIFGLLFGMYGYRQKATYDGFASLSFVKASEKTITNPTDYEFDNFYSLQAGQLLASAVHGWLADATFISQIYGQAGVALPQVSIGSYSRLIETEPLPGSTLLIRTNAATAEQAAALATRATTLVKERIDTLASAGAIDTTVVLTGESLAERQPPQRLLILVAGLAFGLLIGLLLVGLGQTLWPIQVKSKN